MTSTVNSSSSSSSSSPGLAVAAAVIPPQQQQQQQQQRTTNSNHNHHPQCTCPTSLHTLNETSTRSYSQCPVCLSKFDGDARTPVALNCTHTICVQCASLLIPNIIVVAGGGDSDDVVSSKKIQIDGTKAVVNYPLLQFLDYEQQQRVLVVYPPHQEEEAKPPILDLATTQLCRIAKLIRTHTVSRSVHRKTIVLLNSLTPDRSDQSKLLKPIKSLAERCLVELTSSCAHVSHYHAQQQLWAAIRARACQFMGPAMQDEALKLVLLALEDGSALSRKVLVMFVVQRLAPQFPQASKTSVGHIVQLLYRASAFDVLKRPGNSSLMTLRPEFRNYEALRREHDTQIMKIGLEAGIRFTPEQWSSLLYGDTSQKPLMQSIIDKLQSPQTFQELLKEYLVSVQRLSNADSQFLVSLHPHFKVLAGIEICAASGSTGVAAAVGVSCGNVPSTDPHQQPPSTTTTTTTTTPIPQLLESLHAVLLGLITFTANRKHQRNGIGAASTPAAPSSVLGNRNGFNGGMKHCYGGTQSIGHHLGHHGHFNNNNNNSVPQQQQQYHNHAVSVHHHHNHPHHLHQHHGHHRQTIGNNGSAINNNNNNNSDNNLVHLMQANLCI